MTPNPSHSGTNIAMPAGVPATQRVLRATSESDREHGSVKINEVKVWS